MSNAIKTSIAFLSAGVFLCITCLVYVGDVHASTLLDWNAPGDGGHNWSGWTWFDNASGWDEPGWRRNDWDSYWYMPRSHAKTDYGNIVTATIDASDRAPSTDSGASLHVYNTGGSSQVASWWYLFRENFGTQGLSDENTNRLSFYLKGSGWPMNNWSNDSEAWNIHFGTYLCWPGGGLTGDDCPKEASGHHYYHWLTINPDAWVHVELDPHPQHKRGDSAQPSLQPAAPRNYFQYMNSFYIETDASGSQEYWVDELNFHQTTEIENDISIASVWTGYWPNTEKWEIGWNDSSFGASYGDGAQSTFEVRWSTSPITNANYAQAAMIEPEYNEVGTSNRVTRKNPWKPVAWTRFSLPASVQGNSKVYFAIKDVSSTANGDGHNAPSSNIHTIDYALGNPDTTPPTDPTNPAASSNTENSILLSWTASTDDTGVSGYEIERCQGASCSNFTYIATNVSSPFTDTGLTASTSYSYRIRAYDAAGNYSNYSSVASATTLAPDLTPPTDPTSLTATEQSSGQIDLAWTASTDNRGIDHYTIERCQGSGCSSFTQIATSVTSSYQDTGLQPETTYTYRVRAYDAANNQSNYSNTSEATTPEQTDVLYLGGYDAILDSDGNMSKSIAIPIGADFAVVSVGGWSDPENTVDTISFAGTDMTYVSNASNGYGEQIYMYVAPVSVSGSQPLAITMTNAYSEGGIAQIVFFSGVDQSNPVRDSAAESVHGGSFLSTITFGNLTSEPGDMGVVMGVGYEYQDINVEVQSQTKIFESSTPYNLDYYGAAYKLASGTSTTLGAEGSYPGAAAVVLASGSGGSGGGDTTPPTLTETTAIPTYTKNQTPDYTFQTDEAGTISYSGECSSSTTNATIGTNTITLNTLQRGLHANCQIQVTDSSGNESDPLSISPFTITYQSDANEDGTVNIFDYNLMIQNFGTTSDCSNPSDTDNDCDVDIFDYSILVGDFGGSV